MLLKIVLILGVIAAVYFYFSKKSMPLTRERRDTKKRHDDDETMVECATCSTYITTSEAIVSAGSFYCSVECRDKV